MRGILLEVSFQCLFTPLRFIIKDKSLRKVRENKRLSPALSVKRQEKLRFSVIDRALRILIKKPHAVDLIVKKLDADRMLFIDRENVDDVAAYRKMTAALDLIHPFIAGRRQLLLPSVPSDLLSDRDLKCTLLQQRWADHLLRRFHGRSKDDARSSCQHGSQCPHPVTQTLRTGECHLKAGLFDKWKGINRRLRQEESEVFFPAENILLLGHDDDGRPERLHGRRECQRLLRTCDPRQDCRRRSGIHLPRMRQPRRAFFRKLRPHRGIHHKRRKRCRSSHSTHICDHRDLFSHSSPSQPYAVRLTSFSP